jgi:hypothetical protein
MKTPQPATGRYDNPSRSGFVLSQSAVVGILGRLAAAIMQPSLLVSRGAFSIKR